jgi:hypothetical protein
MKLLTRNKEQGETLLRLEKTLIKTNNNDLVQWYDSVLIKQRNNDDALSCVAQLKIENAMLKSQVEFLNLEKLALSETYDMLSYSHDNLLHSHIMLNVAHEVVIDSLNSCEPHSCSCANLDNILSCANPCCLKKGQSLIEQRVVGSKGKLLENKKTRQLRRRRHAQPPEDIHGRMVKKLEKEETTTSVKLHKKEVPKTINEAINMNKEKCKNSVSHVNFTDNLSKSPNNKKEREEKGGQVQGAYRCSRSSSAVCSASSSLGHSGASYLVRTLASLFWSNYFSAPASHSRLFYLGRRSHQCLAPGAFTVYSSHSYHGYLFFCSSLNRSSTVASVRVRRS